jgi:cytidine deaminase
MFICLMGFQTVKAQEKKSGNETVIIQTSAQCGDCKERIEELLNYTKGVTFAELDLVTKKVLIELLPKELQQEFRDLYEKEDPTKTIK